MATNVHSRMPYLNAVVSVCYDLLSTILTLLSNETLRLQPPAPVGIIREPIKGSGGAVVAERYETFLNGVDNDTT